MKGRKGQQRRNEERETDDIVLCEGSEDEDTFDLAARKAQIAQLLTMDLHLVASTPRLPRFSRSTGRPTAGGEPFFSPSFWG